MRQKRMLIMLAMKIPFAFLVRIGELDLEQGSKFPVSTYFVLLLIS